VPGGFAVPLRRGARRPQRQAEEGGEVRLPPRCEARTAKAGTNSAALSGPARRTVEDPVLSCNEAHAESNPTPKRAPAREKSQQPKHQKQQSKRTSSTLMMMMMMMMVMVMMDG
jgi:hypothetical protein